MENIPLHDFTRDDASSIPFELIPLEQKGTYDTSVPHRHNYYEVFIFEKGGGEHDIDFNTIPILDKSIHFVSPGQVHNVRRQVPSFGYVILFSRDFYSLNLRNTNILSEFPFLNNNSSNPVLNLDEDEFIFLKRLTMEMEKEQPSKDLLKEELIRSFLNSFLIYCRRFFNTKVSANEWKEDTLSFKFKQMIENNFSRIHAVSEYASMLNVSEKQLHKTVKTQIGLLPSDLIFDRIILEAKRLVLYSDYSFQEIAYFLNYSDASHFTKFFKSKTGHSPGEFRKQGKKYQD